MQLNIDLDIQPKEDKENYGFTKIKYNLNKYGCDTT